MSSLENQIISRIELEAIKNICRRFLNIEHPEAVGDKQQRTPLSTIVKVNLKSCLNLFLFLLTTQAAVLDVSNKDGVRNILWEKYSQSEVKKTWSHRANRTNLTVK